MDYINLWKSSASLMNLRRRAKIISKIRSYFSRLGVLEVETPTLSHYSVTDIHFVPFETQLKILKKKMWLIPSPEYHMKRLLAQNIGSIYQISRSFRNNELGGPHHNPEFTMLEWYQTNCNMFDFMKKIEKLLIHVVDFKEIRYMTYRSAFIYYLGIDPLLVKKDQLLHVIKDVGLYDLTSKYDSISTLLELLFTLKIESQFNKNDITFIYHYPSDQAALASINNKDSRVADRFEIFLQGIELGNGFYELTSRVEQEERFKLNNVQRKINNKCEVKIDQFFLSEGLPPCSGIAIGLDRLIMLCLRLKNINEVIAFPIDRC